MEPIQVIDSEGQILFSCAIEDKEKAYDYAKSMEELGIEVNITAPSLPESLGLSLGATAEDQEGLKDELNNEIGAHDYGCCVEESSEDS